MSERSNLIRQGAIVQSKRRVLLHDAISFERVDGSIGTNYGPTYHVSTRRTLPMDKAGREQAARDIATYKANPAVYLATAFEDTPLLDKALMAVILASRLDA